MNTELKSFYSNTPKLLFVVWILIFVMNSSLDRIKINDISTLIWPTTEGVIISSTYSEEMNFDDNPQNFSGYKINLVVNYIVDKEYDAFFSPGATSLSEQAEKYINKYSVGQVVRVRYNRINPEEIRLSIPLLYPHNLHITLGWIGLTLLSLVMIINHRNIVRSKKYKSTESS